VGGPAERPGTGKAAPVALNELARLPVDVLSLTDIERSTFAHSANLRALTGTNWCLRSRRLVRLTRQKRRKVEKRPKETHERGTDAIGWIRVDIRR
jgi:hypothetical protein